MPEADERPLDEVLLDNARPPSHYHAHPPDHPPQGHPSERQPSCIDAKQINQNPRRGTFHGKLLTRRNLAR